MIELAIVALVIGLVASLLGFTRVAGTSFAIAKVVAAVFLVFFLILVLIAWGVGSAIW